MSEQDDIFENLFRESVQDMEMPVSDNLWKRIKITIEGKKKRRFFWIFFSGLASIAAICFFLSYNTKNISPEIAGTKTIDISKNNTTKENSVTTIREKKSESTAQKENISDKVSGSTKTLVNDSAAAKNTRNAPEQNYSASVEKSSIGKKKEKNQLKKRVQESQPINSKKESKKIISQEKKKNYNPTQFTTINNENQVSQEIKKENKIQSHTNPEKKQGNNEVVTTSKTTLTKDSSVTGSAKIVKATASDLIVTTEKPDSSKKEVKDSLLKNTFEKPTNDTNITITKKDTGKDPNVKMIIGLEGGMVSPQIKYTDNYYNGVFKNTAGFNALSYTGISIKSKLNITLGLGVYTMNSNASLDQNQGTYKDTVKLTKIDSSGNPYLVDSLITKNKMGRWSGKYRYLYAIIPLTFEYTFALGKNLRITPGIGITLNQCIHAPFANYTDFSITPNFSLKAGYMLNKKWQIYLASNYSYFNKPTYQQYSGNWDYKPAILPAYISINMGMRYYLGK